MKAPDRSFSFTPGNYPTVPGCYLMKNAQGQVIYVGKAKNLRRRLSSYFSTAAHGKARRLAARVRDIEIILVNNETESLILENTLIKRYRPAYNVMLMRDGSGYAYIVLTGERYPRCVIYRKSRSNKALEHIEEVTPPKRFGPYVSRRYRDALLNFVNEYFGLRVCKPLAKRVCLRHEIGKCSGICEQLASPAAYAEAVRGAASLLSYHSEDLIAELKKRMAAHAEALEFEKAIKLREQIKALEATLEKQIVDRDVHHDQDIAYFSASRVLVARVVGGAISGANLFDLQTQTNPEEVRRNFLVAYYCQVDDASDQWRELIVNQLDDPQAVSTALMESCGRRIKITVPRRGTKLALLKLCEQNMNHNHTLPVHKL
jgi:excinuclease ABC subunit C